MFEFLSTPEGVKLTAGVTIMVIAFAFLIGLHPFKTKKRLVLASPGDQNLWTAGDYYMFLNSLIRASRTPDELKGTMALIEGYYDKQFRVPVSTFDRKEYYARLLNTYCKKEIEFETIPVELCKN
jgi:hypothetical protein